MTALAAVDDSPMWAPPGPEESRALSAPRPAAEPPMVRLDPESVEAIAVRFAQLVDLSRLIASVVEPIATRTALLLAWVAPADDSPDSQSPLT